MIEHYTPGKSLGKGEFPHKQNLGIGKLAERIGFHDLLVSVNDRWN